MAAGGHTGSSIAARQIAAGSNDKIRALAASRSDPWWDPPAAEAANIAASHAAVEKYLAQDPEREKRLIFFIAKTGNRSCVAYFYREDAPTDDRRIEPLWILIDPKERAAACRKTGVEDTDQLLLEGLNALEDTVYGIIGKSVTTEAGKPMYKFSLRGLDDTSHRVQVQVVKSATDGTFQGLCRLRPPDGEGPETVVRINYGYVQCCKGKLIDVEYIHVYGTRVTPPYSEVRERFLKA